MALFGVLTLISQAVFGAEPTSRQLLPPNSTAILEIRQPQIAFQHALVKRILPILQQSRAFQDALGNPDLDVFRDSIQHFESQLGLTLPQIIEQCAGEGLLVSATADEKTQLTAVQFSAILTGRDPDKVARLPEVTLSLLRKIMAGKEQNLPDPLAKSHQGHAYFQFGEVFYAVAGPRWLLSNREAGLQGMFDRLDGKAANSDTSLASQLVKTSSDTPGIRLIADIAAIKKIAAYNPVTQWPPKEVAPIILAGGWLDLIQRSQTVIADIDLGHDTIVAGVKFPAKADRPTPGTAGYFAVEPNAAAAPLFQPPQLIYSMSWYRDYWKMWENRNQVPLPDQIKQLEMQIAATETGNLGYSGFDIIRLLGPHHRFVVTRPGPNPYRVEMTERLPEFALVLDLKDEKEFKDKVLLPIQRILGIVAVTNKMVAQTTKHQSAEISALRFTEDPASVQASDRVRYNFEPSYSVTRGHLVIGSTSHIVRALIDDMDRISRTPASTAATPAPGLTEQQILSLGELSQVLTDVHGLAVRNAVLNDGLTISEAESELNIVQQIVAAIGRLHVHAGFGPDGFEYRLNLEAKATP